MDGIWTPDHPGYSDEWYTPASEIRVILDALGLDRFDCDPASPGSEISKVPARTHYTRSQDGLAQDWSGVVWMNPPYSDKESWLCKAILEVCDGRAKAVLALLPAATTPAWFHDFCAGWPIWFRRGRIKFIGRPYAEGRGFGGNLLVCYSLDFDLLVRLRAGLKETKWQVEIIPDEFRAPVRA